MWTTVVAWAMISIVTAQSAPPPDPTEEGGGSNLPILNLGGAHGVVKSSEYRRSLEQIRTTYKPKTTAP